MEVLSSEEDNSEVVSLDRAVFRISLYRCKQDLQPHRLLLVVLRRRAHFEAAQGPSTRSKVLVSLRSWGSRPSSQCTLFVHQDHVHNEGT